ncbi:uncharacterized protein LOC107272660, partial [Cephus cinctus]|uniref:Uncharacterized protein LOC107272660 n=1 Tax=Cephus cinctus TaxID=211228 RepID=A0AAJ7C9V1_CEPCN
GGGTVRESRSDRVRWDDLESAFKGRIRTGVIANLRHKDLGRFLEDSRKLFTARVKHALRKDGNLKVNVVLSCKFETMKAGQIVEELKFFNTKNEVVLPSTDISDWFNTNVKEKLLAKVEDFQERESGWSLVEIINLAVNINRYIPIHGGLSTFIELPKEVQSKKAVVNIRNNDPYCFLWSVTAALHPVKNNVSVIGSYPHFSSVLRYEGLNFPIGLKDISK